jgi:hypothetical protein
LVILESCVLPCTVNQLTSEVISKYFFPGVSTPVTNLLLAVESSLGSMINAVGNVNKINTAISAQTITSATQSLTSTATYGNKSSWVKNPSSLSESHQDQWVVIGDLYAAVKDIKENFANTGCESIDFGFTYNIIKDGSNIPISLNLNFTSSSIPSSYSDCGSGTEVIITDSNGSSLSSSVNVAALQNNPAGANISLVGLNVFSSITVQVNFCASDDVNTCQEKSTQIIALQTPCPTNVTVTNVTESTATVNFANNLGTGVNYEITITDVNTLVVAGSASVSQPPAQITQVFAGLADGTIYEVNITITNNGVPTNCSPVLFTTAGINCDTFSTTNTGLSGANDIYLGYTEAGGIQTPYYYNPDLQNIYIAPPAVPLCYAPIVVTNSNVIVPATGVVTLLLNYGLVPGVSIVIESSTDGINYTNPDVGANGVRVYASGVTSGSLYLRMYVDCTTSISDYTIFRYDFTTTQWLILQSPSDCRNDIYESIANACPAGVKVGRQTLVCDGTTYNIFGGGVDSYWYFIRKYVRSGVTFYVYAGWTQASGVTSILECCACPAFILSDRVKLYVQEGQTLAFSAPYVLGDGDPIVTVVQTTTNGTLTQLAPGSNAFSYTNNPGFSAYADTLQVQIAPQTAGDCESSIVTIQIQIIPCDISMKYLDQPLFAFIDTNTYTAVEGANIRTALINLIADWNVIWGYVGSLYFIPTTSSRWLGYQKAIVDDGVSANLSVDPSWTALQLLPTSWTGGAPIYKNGVFMVVFSNEAATDYHDTTLAAGFAGAVIQPTVAYLEDANAYADSLSGTTNTAWATGLGLFNNQFPDGFNGIFFPFTTKFSTGAEAANILMSLAAYTGEMIPPNEYGVHTIVDVSGYLMQGLIPSTTNPYQGAVPPAPGPPIEPLYTQGWLMFLDNEYRTDTYANIAGGLGTDYRDWSTKMGYTAIQCTGGYTAASVGTLLYQFERCDTGAVDLVDIITPALYPTYGLSYRSALADNSLGIDVCFKFIGYSVGTPAWELSAYTVEPGCETCFTVFLVEDCASGFQYKVDMTGEVGVTVGNIYKITNNGADFIPGDGRDDWLTTDAKCVSIISGETVAELSTVTILGFADCPLCILTL